MSSKPNFKNPTGSINASVGRIDSKWKSVTEQAGIYAGEEGYNINVGNNTTLEGAVIKSEAPKAKNKLTTKSLEMKDIKNEAEYTYSNNGIGYNYYGSKKKLEEMKTKDKKGYDKIYNNIGLVPNLGVGSKGKASSTTQSAISDGILTVDGKEIDTKTINTNTENTLHQLDKIFDKKKIEERQELARLFSKNAFEQLHNWHPTTKDGKIAKSIAHGIIGEVAARMAGNAPGSGFKATMTNELLIGEIKKVAKYDPALAQWLSAAVGGVVNKVSGESSNSGAAVASYATKWNENQQYSGYDRMDHFTPEMFDKDKLDTIVNTHKQEIEAFAINEARYLRSQGKLVIDNSFDYMSVQGEAALGVKAFAGGCIIDRHGNIYGTFAAGPGVSLGVPVAVSFGVIKDKDYTNSIPGYFGTITARGGVGGTIGVSGSGAVTEVTISPSVSLSASAGLIWYIGNIEDF